MPFLISFFIETVLSVHTLILTNNVCLNYIRIIFIVQEVRRKFILRNRLSFYKVEYYLLLRSKL